MFCNFPIRTLWSRVYLNWHSKTICIVHVLRLVPVMVLVLALVMVLRRVRRLLNLLQGRNVHLDLLRG